MSMQRYVVLSDMHFGMEESNVNKKELLQSLASFLEQASPLMAVIFAGDLLDLNLSTFVRSIEGSKSNELVGFREFLQILHSQPNLNVGEWVYIPGNHDYRVWDILATKKNCVDVLANSKSLRSVETPLYREKWDQGQAFISGVFPIASRKKVTVAYPDYSIDSNGWKIVITHGHYLDQKQMLNNKLEDLINKDGMSKDEAVRKMFIDTAVYQTVAGCASFTDWTRKWVNNLAGPSAWSSRLTDLFTKLLKRKEKEFLISPLRGEAISEGQLSAMEFYLKYFGKYDTAPDYVVYGHTHQQDYATTEKIRGEERLFSKAIEVYNAGSFYKEGALLASFLCFDLPDEGKPIFSLCCIDQNFDVQTRNTGD